MARTAVALLCLIFATVSIAQQTPSANPVREAKPLAATPSKEPAMDPSMPPLAVADLKSVLNKDIAVALRSGALASSTHTGVTIGVVQHGIRQIFTYGAVKSDSVFEIGSISKTFTALILAQMVEQNLVRLDEPVRELLPPKIVAKPVGTEITLLDLSDQHSGLPRMPDNFARADPNNPYADYNAKLLYAFLAKQGVALPANAPSSTATSGLACSAKPSPIAPPSPIRCSCTSK